MKKVLTIGFLLMSLNTSVVFACSCLWQGIFPKIAAESELVIRATVKSYGKPLSHGENLYATMTLEIVEVLKGRYKSDTIQLLGDNGLLCRQYVTSKVFVKGEEFLFALPKSGVDSQPISVCGEYWASIKTDTIQGYDMKENKRYTMTLDELKEQLDD